MDVKEAIEKRRAYRSLDPVEITDDIVKELAASAQLAPSCFNYQPWNYIFIYEPDILDKLKDVLSEGNEWAYNASMMIAVFSRKDLDCVIREREYYLFDTGMATALIILRATEIGLVAHPVAGFSPRKTREVLGIPEDMNIITLIIVGNHAKDIKPELSEKQAEVESKRPERKELDEFLHINKYGNKFDG